VGGRHAHRIANRDAIRRTVDDAVGTRDAVRQLDGIAQVARNGHLFQAHAAGRVQGRYLHAVLAHDEGARRHRHVVLRRRQVEAHGGIGARQQFAARVVDRQLRQHRPGTRVDGLGQRLHGRLVVAAGALGHVQQRLRARADQRHLALRHLHVDAQLVQVGDDE
jgi:hypothetical protein